MIYTVSEWLATISESLIIFFFLVKILSYKNMAQSKKIIGTVVFCCLQCTSSLILDQFFVFEGLYVIITIFIYLLFCWIMLENPIWLQTIVILLVFACLFTINIATMLITSLLTHSTSADVLLLRNPVRILLLFITKAMLIFTLIILTNIFEKKKVIFHVSQCIIMTAVLLTTLFSGAVMEKIVIDTDVASWEVSAIVICMIAINILLFSVLYLTSSRNRVENNQALLKLQIANEQQKLQDSIRWNTEVNTLRHDLKNHLLCISEYIRLQQTNAAMEYIEKLTGQVKKELPYHMMTNSVAVNAILDLKKLVCDENQIDIKYFVLEELPKIDETDLCVILANLLDNAIEAASKEEKRQIRLSMEIIGNYFRIVVQNQIAESVLKNNKKLGTTKKNRKIHGFGLQSVEDAVERNDGMSNFSEENGWFVADVMLKIHES
ncbi:sensor histidine kinase [Ruminococcus sp.]|jgi:two-component system sensor histidine kinase AgrC|uniref:sensor histidine kinase n=1 Tax=Ruminococcus sp. TaxID=41978 RepID=UPI0026757E76|nr:sensor histidine kinase [uncultured Ruminococcus sp.]